jgi:ApaG protein
MANPKPDIQIKTESHFLADQSSPENKRYLWSYDISILNNSPDIIQLLHRYWKIIDINGKAEEVRGPGVIGLQPIIKPGKEFSYSSFCQLTTSQGSMEGYYEMQTLEEVHFAIEIEKFLLKGLSSTMHHLRSSLH